MDIIKVNVWPDCSGNANFAQVVDPALKKFAVSQCSQLRFGERRAYTVLYHKIELCFAVCVALAAIFPEATENAYEEFCNNISRSSLLLKTDSVENVI